MTPPKEDGPHVVVTLESIYALALETRSDVAEIKTTVTQLVKQDEDHEKRIRALEDSNIKSLTERIVKHEGDIDSLKAARWKLVGAGAVAGFIPTLIALFSYAQMTQ